MAENRKIGAIGFQYQRLLVHRRVLDFSYVAELRPAILESDPTSISTLVQTAPAPVTYPPGQPTAVVQCLAGSSPSFTNSSGQTYHIVYTCGRRTVVGQGFSPAGLRVNLLPRHRLQPTFSALGGYMFSTQPVPIINAGSYNFTFEFGGGFEFYRTHRQSIRLEYQVQHFSNKNSAIANPGVDSGLVKVTYAFGR